MKKILLIALCCVFNLSAQYADREIVSAKFNNYYISNSERSFSFGNVNNGIIEDKLIDAKTKSLLTNPYINVDRDKYMKQVTDIFEEVLKSKNIDYSDTRSAAMVTILRSGKISGIYMILNNKLKALDAFGYEEMELKWKELILDPKYIEWDETSQFVQVVFSFYY